MTELQHHGIKGQKWGVRRYQNSDGSLTEKGKKRYSKELYKRLKKDDIPYAEDMLRNDRRVKDYIKNSKSGGEILTRLKGKASDIETAIEKRTNQAIASANRQADKLNLDSDSLKYERLVMDTINSDKKIANLEKELDNVKSEIVMVEQTKTDRVKEREALAKDLIGAYASKPMAEITINTINGSQNIALSGSAVTELLLTELSNE